MRVLYVLERYPELSQTFVAQEIIALSELGVEVSVAALQRGSGGLAPAPGLWASEVPPLRRLAAAGSIALHRPARVADFLASEASWPPPSGSRKARGLGRIAPFVAAARAADHIHAHFATEATDIARLLSSFSGTGYSFSAHAADAYSERTKLAANLDRCRFARACSNHVGRQLVAAAPAAADRVHEIPIAIDFEGFRRTTPYSPDGPVVAVGRLVEKKGFDDLISAFSRLSDEFEGRSLKIVGEGPLRDTLQRLIESTGCNAELLGAKTNPEVAKLLAEASLFALTPKTASGGDRDGLPAAIAEAMAAGLPIVSTSQPGIPDLVDSASGVLADPGDVQSITARLEALLALPTAARIEMGRHGSERARDLHSRERIASQLIRLFAQARDLGRT